MQLNLRRVIEKIVRFSSNSKAAHLNQTQRKLNSIIKAIFGEYNNQNQHYKDIGILANI